MKPSKKTQVKRHYAKARRLALEIVEELARDILRKHPNLTDFCMAMGSVTFTLKAKYPGTQLPEMIHPNERRYCKRLDDFLEEWDDIFKLSGEPMQFTADGPKITDW